MISAKLKSTDEARFAAALQKMVAISGEPVEDIMKQQGRLFAVEMSKITERFGKTQKSGANHKRDIMITIKSIYKNSTSIAKLVSRRFGEKDGRRFWNWMRRGNFTKAQEMLDRSNISSAYFKGARISLGVFDGGNLHKKYRFRGSREILVVSNYREVQRYIKLIQSRAGIAKSGWAAAAEDLGGTRGIPLYAKKGHGRNGRGSVTGKGGRSKLIVRNNVDHIGEEAMFKGNESTVWRDQTKKIERSIKGMMKRRLKQTKQRFKV